MKTENTSLPSKCPRCRNALAADAPEGLCPRCLAQLYLAEDSVVTGAEIIGAETPSPEEIAPYFPHLEILTCLGRGGMGVVYKARQKSLNRMVALKILAPEREKNPQFAERFAREAQALARLSHPHIVTIYDFGQAEGLFFLLMEFVDGLNLRQLLLTRRLEPQAALAIVAPICDALQYAHDQGIVHRDLKPENLLLDKSGQVKIADFGIAKMLGGTAGFDEEPCVGTPAYMAPEQSMTDRAVDHRADIYSLGIVFYEMLTGELPAGPIELPSRKVHIDVRLDEIVLRALKHEPELRYQKAGQMKTAVETLSIAEQPIQPKTPTPASASNANGSQVPDFQGIQRMQSKTLIKITLVALFLLTNCVVLYRGIGYFSSKGSTPQDPTLFNPAKRGFEAFEKKDYKQAAIAFDEAIRQDPKHSEAHRWRGDAAMNLHEFDKALSEYEEAIRLDPNNASAYLSRGAVWTENREFDKAIVAFNTAIQLNPRLADNSFYKRYRSAAESLQEKSQQNPKFAEATKSGLEAFNKRDYKQAALAFDDAISHDPNHSEAHRWRGDAAMNLREIDKALSEYDEAIRLDPNNASAYLSRGAVWTAKGDSDKAIAAFNMAIELNPKLAEKSFYKEYLAVAKSLQAKSQQNPKFAEAAKRGLDAFVKRDYKQAAIAFDEAIRQDPKHSEAHRWRGDAAMNLHEFDKALSEYDEAIRLDPKNANAYLSRGVSWTEKGENGKAIAALDTAIELNPQLADDSFYKRYRSAAESFLNLNPIPLTK